MGARLNLVGNRFGIWTVMAYIGGSVWTCQCDCGNVRGIKTCDLRSGSSKSCGCVHAGTARGFRLLHGGKGTPEYRTWKHMRERCSSPSCEDYKNYGGRGISICRQWDDFTVFLLDMGPRPGRGYSIERLDVNGNYEPSNCVWATTTEQARNKRTTTYIGTEKLVEIAEARGEKPNTLHRRRYRGQPI